MKSSYQIRRKTPESTKRCKCLITPSFETLTSARLLPAPNKGAEYRPRRIRRQACLIPRKQGQIETG